MLTFTNEFVNLVMDGNSLIFGNATPNLADRIGEQLMALAPISGGMTYKNVGLGGATFQSMAGDGESGIATTHAAFEPDKQNLLFILEGVNSAMNGGTGASLISDCKAYIAAVRAVHPEWRIFIIIAPAYKDDDNPSSPGNAAIDEYNAYVRSEYVAMGAEDYVETRPPGGRLAYNPPYVYTQSTFTQSGDYEDAVHLNRSGNGIMAQCVADKLKTIPNVAPTGTANGSALTVASSNILLGWL